LKAFISDITFKTDKEFPKEVYIAYAINYIGCRTVSNVIKISNIVPDQKISINFFDTECNLLHRHGWNAVCIWM